ncbi:hypothetical protein [Sporomusa acidovorans]|uniref:Uncharacterized protein n=1 Tax=Sporomusa acidovorans (strain ATCC 49682 / DSM 3132 / Mol) TaxID=1123286 RepID=A0ABZ3J1B8_SPOA4|nr:hypothetical protein [Sporomusa acidovorans]OZC14994.1 hypothetical protein SPACI_51090 [Sporomusa acidovorans DSM 3132]SDE83626.1 hypothetical protein SAMN04488499_102326 [Sporomusa acidovorans]
MYKLIIGNVRVTVDDDSIKRDQAAAYAKQAISAAGLQGKLLSHVGLSTGPDGIEVSTTEKAGCRMIRKNIKQSMLDGILDAAKEKLYPTGTFSEKDSWFDNQTGQEWRGEECELARKEVLKKLEEWIYEQNTQAHT